MRRWGRYRQNFWVRALIVGLLLTGEIHLFSAEILHHHDDVARVCQVEHQGGPYLHAAQQVSPLCPICQIVRNGSVRPSVQSAVQRQDQETSFRPVTGQPCYTANLTSLLPARAPPLS